MPNVSEGAEGGVPRPCIAQGLAQRALAERARGRRKRRQLVLSPAWCVESLSGRFEHPHVLTGQAGRSRCCGGVGAREARGLTPCWAPGGRARHLRAPRGL